VKDEAFIDTGAFVAFLDRSDRQHAAAKALFGDSPARLATSVLVVSEAYSWFLHRTGESGARTFRQFLSGLSGLRILDADRGHREAIWKKLDALRGTKLTFVDASSLVCLEREGISTVWGTDFDLAIEGARVLPGPPA
jgi:predicted nucleic acid-binding protein